MIPAVIANMLTGVRSYVEHNATATDMLHNARSRASWFWTLMDVGANYHLEHHLYPGIPQWRLPRVHRFLKLHGKYDDLVHIDNSIFGSYRYALAKFAYPDGRESIADIVESEMI